AASQPTGTEACTLAGLRAIGPDCFGALCVPLRRGRIFTEHDRDRSRPVAIVNETFVKRFFKNDPDQALLSRAQLGATPDNEADTPIMDIVGVVGDTKQAFEAAGQAAMFVP